MAAASFDPSRVIVVAGPTGSGKSSLALSLGEQFNGELVCMDSMQLYAELRVGTARPEAADLARVPHHLFGSVSVHDHMTSSTWCQMAEEVVADIQHRGKTAILVGGTGLYMKAMFEGMASLPETPPALRTRINQRLERHGLPRLYALLKRLDPRGANRLHGNDAQRIQRFLEVRLLTGSSILELWERQEEDTTPKPITLGLQVERAHLWERLAARARSWLSGPWINEVRNLMDAGLLDRVLEIGPIGYGDIAQYLQGTLSYEHMVERVFIATRQYAKRQMTWFRKTSYIQWFPFEPNSGYNMNCVTDFIKKTWGNRPILKY